MSTAYDPQSDGQTEKVNQCLKQYLRAMVYDQQAKWSNYLSLAEWWYNTNWHSATKLSPFEALYGYPPPLLALGSAPKSIVESVNIFLRDRQATLARLKANLKKAQNRMKKNEDKHRTERKFSEGDWVYLKLQPYRQMTVGGIRNQKLSSRYYGPFEVLKCIGSVAYKLSLPPGSLIHSVFHVSQLKAKIGSTHIPSPTLPLEGPNTEVDRAPQLVLGRRMIKKRNAVQSQLLIQWRNQNPEDATWEDYEVIAQEFPEFIREDTNYLKEGVLQREVVDLVVTVKEEGSEKGKYEGGRSVKQKGQVLSLHSESVSGTQ